MASKKTPKGKFGFFGVRAKPSGNFRVEFSDVDRRWWLGTYPTVDEAGIRMEEMSAKKEKKRSAVVVAPSESDKAAMARFAREHTQYIQAELEHYGKRNVDAKKKGVNKEDEADPSTVIPIESPDEDWDDSEGCDDPT
ncbi:ap2-containing protein [Hordeum vulgare]|nr:ap2-containing protein [Hordeum vulgare]